MNDESMVYVVDDDASVRKALERLVTTAGLEAKTFGSAREFLDSDRKDVPSCLVLDVKMPEMNGLELQKELAAIGSAIPIIFITGHGDVPMAVKAFQAGAADFLQKPFNARDLLDAIRNALEVSQGERSARTQRAAILGRIEALSAPERRLLDLVVQGHPIETIAEDLQIAQKTLSDQRAQIMEKLGAETLAELVELAEQARSDSG